ncbi:DUF445 domain-containing protein [Nocardioides sp. Kera G14]|uniref:DUF445 domain-containing protein n=1 Tax=Nocardioides sp. Kera G14 TaxID=2884264 RepID=UPI001D117846|nr:DUF445 domain-containing protein [Nocardioides sp. Kera G14]UDY25342.1 DUF445 domain-containing protein [Nocardioides sp. Kera G14]
MAGDTAGDAVRRQALRRMRTLATGLLCFAAVVYLLTLDRGGFWGFVNTGAEASMVGAIADWFAVTALFRHPLGLPIPHTALIPKRKDELGRGLEEFVGENFLHESIIRDRIATVKPALRVGTWLSDPANARTVVDEISTVAAAGLARVRDDHVSALLSEAVFPRLRQEPISPILGGLLAEAVEDDLHRGLVDLGLLELREWLVENPDTVTDVLEERAPWWTPQALNHGVASRIHLEMIKWIEDIQADSQHRARFAFDSWLAQLATGLQEDPETQERAERLKDRMLEHPQVLASSISVWNALRRALTTSLKDPSGAVRERLLHELTNFSAALLADEALRNRIDALASDAAVFIVSRYGSEATAIITHTIERWDGREASERIELHVGRDLQFIRINGTIVGGLVGVLIHAVTVLVT